ncbi:hypothetical protein [Natronincola ferrireducens]|uniref:Uncharacterized protein n=1 Tax=Natronincola ferrireducens TaxID=393762 RepID=A0A1G9C954_9FIRM|nr:hypothetical protein [Natronincola ferrireducens]SDK48181.1 hypothetical protein SAMN05660472_01400 [Natronincola ferrireducens]
MIQIDDAGSGSLLGGTIIGVLRVETNEYYYDVIPLEYYKDKNFENKIYINYVVTIVENIFKKLNVDKTEVIEICRGYMFDALSVWLKKHNYNYIKTKIKNPLQTKIEKTFENYTVHLGLPKSFISYTKYPFHFHRILKWIYADYNNRSLLCKTGWKSWKKYGNLEVQHTQELIKNNNLMCLKCYEVIPKNTAGTAITYYSNKLTKVFVHNECV